MLAPILLFTYKRLDTLIQTVSSLKENDLASDSELFIFSDGAKKSEDEELVSNVRNFIASVKGFRKVTIINRSENWGLAKSIIEGTNSVINDFGKVIVLEDDLITSKNFLSYMNQALDHYVNNKNIFTIAGYTPTIKGGIHDVYFTMRASSWGWATWQDRWNEIDWQIKDYNNFKSNRKLKKAFNNMGTDMCKMLHDQMTGKINSWAIRWTYHQFVKRQLTVFPVVSKVQNIGTTAEATHTHDAFNRFYTILDDGNNNKFRFPDNPEMLALYLKQFLSQYSLKTRIKYKLLNFFK